MGSTPVLSQAAGHNVISIVFNCREKAIAEKNQRI